MSKLLRSDLPDPCDAVTRDNLLEIFRGKCVRCRKPATDVHEIVPRSLKRNWVVFSNRVTLCHACHEWAHSRGTNNSQEELTLLRERRLTEYYG